MEWNKRKGSEISEPAIKHLRRNEEIDSIPSTTSLCETTILDLNDDCLLHIFKHLSEEEDLIAVANVCTRFRLNVQDSFSRFSRFKSLYRFRFCDSVELFGACLMLRNFGTFIETIELELRYLDAFTRSQCEKLTEKSLQLLKQYSRPSGLTILGYEIRDNIELIFRPLLLRLRKLVLVDCKVSAELLDSLPKLAPSLRVLKFKHTLIHTSNNENQPFDFSQTKFPKLEEITFDRVKLHNTCVDDFLKRNPQLKKIKTFFCPLNDYVLKSIAEHVLSIEEIKYAPHRVLAAAPTNFDAIKNFGQFKSLKLLELHLDEIQQSSLWVIAAVQELAATNIPLVDLRLRKFYLGKESDRFFDAIVKLKSLKRLDLHYNYDLSMVQIFEICKHLTELYRFDIRRYEKTVFFSFDNILKIIRMLKNVQIFSYYNEAEVKDKICINAEDYKQIAIAVKNRWNKTHMKIGLDEANYTANIPDELINSYKDSLTLIISNAFMFYGSDR